MLCRITWKHLAWEKLIALMYIVSRWRLRLSKIIRVRYERGVLKPLEPVELKEGEEVRIRIEKRLKEKLKDLIGVLGESSEEELEKYLEEAWQP